jgi:hypothetical protein
LFILLVEGESVELFCGENPTKYDNETQECNGGRVMDRNSSRLVVPITTNVNFITKISEDDDSNSSPMIRYFFDI